MKIQILSDIHFEFGYPESKSFINMLDPEGIDVLVLAGDICFGKQAVDVMNSICKRYENSDVIWVHGNHEFYTSDRETVVSRTLEAVRHNKNLHWLDCEAKVIRGQQFIGAPLWFAEPLKEKSSYKSYMNDFRVIDKLESWVYNENERAIECLKKKVTKNSVVITHHLPSAKSVAERFMGDELNCFFVCDLEDSIIKRQNPKLWIHGHTHDSCDYKIETGTRVVCNPRGYPHDLNPDFDIAKVIEL